MHKQEEKNKNGPGTGRWPRKKTFCRGLPSPPTPIPCHLRDPAPELIHRIKLSLIGYLSDVIFSICSPSAAAAAAVLLLSLASRSENFGHVIDKMAA